MRKYDFLFIQNAPAFYKINLFNALSANLRIGVIFLGESNQVVMNKNSLLWKFDSFCLNKKELDKENVFDIICSTFRLWKLMKSLKSKYIIYGGWSYMEFIIMMFLTSRIRNCVISESSIYESSITGVKRIIKRWIVNLCSHAFVSGIPHKEVLLKLGYKGEIHITGGVGLALRNLKVRRENLCNTYPLRYIYTGRLIKKKNVDLLIEAFNENGKPLTIIGNGCNENEFRRKAKSNIIFLGFIENDKLQDIYANHDCFILPSYSEAWGLVVEEALYNGLPVIVSNMVGCNIDMVKNYDSGIIFDCQSIESLQKAISQMELHYQYYKKNVNSIDWGKRDKEQIEAFTSILSL